MSYLSDSELDKQREIQLKRSQRPIEFSALDAMCFVLGHRHHEIGCEGEYRYSRCLRCHRVFSSYRRGGDINWEAWEEFFVGPKETPPASDANKQAATEPIIVPAASLRRFSVFPTKGGGVRKQLPLDAEYALRNSLTDKQLAQLKHDLHQIGSSHLSLSCNLIVVKWADLGDEFLYMSVDKNTGGNRGFIKVGAKCPFPGQKCYSVLQEKLFLDLESSGAFYDLPISCELTGETTYGLESFESCKGVITSFRVRDGVVFGRVEGKDLELMDYRAELDSQLKEMIGMTPAHAIDLILKKLSNDPNDDC